MNSSVIYEINGGKRLYGSVRAESAKNSVLALITASVLLDETAVIKDCPMISDVSDMVDILESIGAETEYKKGDLYIYPQGIGKFEINKELSGKLRASVLMTGALLSRFGECVVFYPGGCSIGARPIDIHLDFFKKSGCSVCEERDKIRIKRCNNKGERVYSFPVKSVGATENAILSSVFIGGSVILKNCACEPEIVDLQSFLNKAGAKIYGAGGEIIVINGVKKLKGAVYKPVGDRIEAGTFLLAGLICGGKIEIGNVKTENISSLIDKIAFSACKIRAKNDIIQLETFGKLCLPKMIVTSPFPGFATDLQSQIASTALFAQGKTLIKETMFESRFATISEFKKFGASVFTDGDTATVNGGKKLHGAEVFAKDLRGCSALILTATGINDYSVVHGINYLERGYLNFDKKLRALGADVKRTV